MGGLVETGDDHAKMRQRGIHRAPYAGVPTMKTGWRPPNEAWLEHVLLRLLNTPTGVPAGENSVAPGDPTISAAVREEVLPLVESLGPSELRQHPSGDLVARFGPPGDDGILVQTYIVSQHGNLMTSPHVGRVVDGTTIGMSGRVAVGQGANQNKGPMAAALAALTSAPAQLRRPVWLAVNTEGSSSHGGSQRIIDDLGVKAAAGIVSLGTNLDVSIGNRGRVDAVVSVKGESCHSSQPWLGLNPIEGAADVVAALRTLPLPEEHPDLGTASATPFQITVEPLAPHTIPSVARILVDRRLLPGEDVDDVIGQLRSHLDGAVHTALEVKQGEFMLPAEIDGSHPVVGLLRAGVQESGRSSGAVFSKNTFDAGYGCAQGIPSCMFGPGRRSFSAGVTKTEAVSLEDCLVAARALQGVFAGMCS